MDKGTLTSLGKYISYLLRHHPEDTGISLDKHGRVRYPSQCHMRFISHRHVSLSYVFFI